MSVGHRCCFRPRVELLESRRMPSTFTVTNLKDDASPGSLRGAITKANDLAHHAGLDTIVFKPGLEGTVRLNGTEISITDSLILKGPGASKIAVNGNFTSRIFNIDNGNTTADFNVTIQGLDLLYGRTSGTGGAILCQENLKLVKTVVRQNQAESGGGAIGGEGNLVVKKSTISGNTATLGTDGGGIYCDTATIIGSTISDNTAKDGGGMQCNTVTIRGSTIRGNMASGGGGGGIVCITAIITDTTISGNTAAANAGGIACATATITGTTISGNHADGRGGGAFFLLGSATFTHSVISGNAAFKEGGGIYAGSVVTSLSISSSAIRANRSLDGVSSGNGGGIFTKAAQTTIAFSTISGNTAEKYGGGVYGAAPVTISRSTIADNSARKAQGGGLFMYVAPLNLTDSTVSGNQALGSLGKGGGLAFDSAPASTVSGCTFSGNRGLFGGAIAVDQLSGALTIRNSTLSGNQATKNGGGIYNKLSLLQIDNSTIAFNRGGMDGTSTGGGITSSQGTLNLESTILALNVDAGGHPDLDAAMSAVNANHSLIGNTGAAANFTPDQTTTDLLGKDPLLAPLANNGGPTQTHALKKGSPCINQGSNPAPALSFDQRGAPHKRKLGLAVDIGAFEKQ